MSSDDGKSPGVDRLGRAVSSKPATMRTGIATARSLGVKVLTAEHAWAAVPGANVRLIRRRTLPFVTEPERPTWHALAACRGVGPALFFLESCGSYDAVRVYCARCLSVRSVPRRGAPRSTACGAGSPRTNGPGDVGRGPCRHAGARRLVTGASHPLPQPPRSLPAWGCRQPALGQGICLCAGHLLTYEIEAKRTLELVRKPLPAAAPRGTDCPPRGHSPGPIGAL